MIYALGDALGALADIARNSTRTAVASEALANITMREASERAARTMREASSTPPPPSLAVAQPEAKSSRPI